jgi:1-acyl-sn-glycerol-3-phosphate acyltransferase
MGRAFGYPCLFLLGIELEAEGMDIIKDNQPCLVISNHQDNIDLFPCGAVAPPRTVSIGKTIIRWFPLFGQIYWLGGNILIDRKNKRSALKTMSETAQIMIEKNIAVWVMPEGTRSKGRGLLPFKKGAFYTAVSSQRPLIAVAINNYSQQINLNKWHAGKIKMRVLDPIQTENLTNKDVEALKNQCYELMKKNIEILDKEVLG